MVYTVSTADTNIEWGLTGEERIVQNVLNLVRTKKYEVPFMREMGVDTDYTDNTLSYIQNNITNDIIELVNTYEPRVTVLSVSVRERDANGDFIIDIEMEV